MTIYKAPKSSRKNIFNTPPKIPLEKGVTLCLDAPIGNDLNRLSLPLNMGDRDDNTQVRDIPKPYLRPRNNPSF